MVWVGNLTRLTICVTIHIYGQHFQQSVGQPVKVTNPARGRLKRRKKNPCPHSRLRIWSREPSRPVSLLILHTRAESVNGAYSGDSSGYPWRRPFIYTVNRDRVSPELIRSRKSVPIAFAAESPPAQGQ